MPFVARFSQQNNVKLLTNETTKTTITMKKLLLLPLFIFGTRVKCRTCNSHWKPRVG